jgi:pyruvate dehydrogenase E2 component (dihydrolipoamide acetyltransferase)
VPVVRDADCKGLAELAQELRSLVAAAREGRLVPEQYEGGSVTLSNLGMFGVDFFLPIINPPESCILGVGAARDRVVAVDGEVRVEPVMTVSVSGDHRVIDGVQAAQFFSTFRELIEEPERLA